MQFREKGKKLLCIRSEYVPEKKRTVGVTVASQDKYLSTVSEEVCRQLEKEEVDQLKEWLSKRTEKWSVDRLSSQLSIIHVQMAKAAEALDDDRLENSLSNERAAEIWEAHEKLSKALKKAGFKKPAKPKKQTVKESDDRQGGLPLDSEKKQ